MRLIASYSLQVLRWERTIRGELDIRFVALMESRSQKNGQMAYPLFMACTPEDFQMRSFLAPLNRVLLRLIPTHLMSRVFILPTY